MNFDFVAQLLSVWVGQGLKRAVISSGSRSAPLALAFARHPAIIVTVVNDERSAGFIALGMAMATQLPVALICTSGTAGLNYGPAVAEAYYQELPLLICTADRPPEWIGQWDGQTINQTNLFGDRVLATYQLPVDTNHEDAAWQVNRIANEAWWTSLKGPVHLNFPFREPFYPEADAVSTGHEPRLIDVVTNKPLLGKYLAHDLVNQWLATEKKLFVVGQGPYQHDLNNALYAAQYYGGAPLLADVISNASQVDGSISHHDLFLMDAQDDLAPELLITVGKSVISKNLKQAIRKWKPKHHWHIEPYGKVADVFQSLTKIIQTDAIEFITKVGEQAYFNGISPATKTYYEAWQTLEKQAIEKLNTVLSTENALTDLVVVNEVIKQLPDETHLHLANSMSVRYANFIGLPKQRRNLVFANRGTSGIDGCSSTAVGFALATTKKTLLITGDVGFFYDQNAFWLENPPQNLLVVLLNNGGGNIFRLIDGPAKQPELSQLFETWQGFSAKTVAEQIGCNYFAATTSEELATKLSQAIDSTKLTILEVFTDKEENAKVFASLKSQFKHL